MLLQKLIEYNQRQERRPSLYSEGPVRYIVHLGPVMAGFRVR